MEENINNKPQKKPKTKHKHGIWSKTVKALLWILATIITLTVLLLGGIGLFLTPERLTSIVEKYANAYIDGQAKISNVELTVWKTFPRMRIDVDSLTIVSNSLESVDSITRKRLPANADTLLTLKHFHGGLNISSLLAGKIGLYDIELQQPMVNLVAVNDSMANYNIIPPSPETEDNDTSSVSLPDIAIDRFTITDALPINYFSLSDSIDAGITLGKTYIDGNGAPRYDIAVNGDVKALLPPLVRENCLPIGLNGKIEWSPGNPYRITLENFNVDIDEIHGTIDTSIDCNDSITVNSLSLTIAQTPINALISHVPEQYRTELADIKTDLTIGAGIELLSPYNLNDTTAIPSLDITVDIPKGKLAYKERYRLKAFAAALMLHVDGKKPNLSSATIKSFAIDGMGISASLNGSLKNPFTDPLMSGKFTGSINFDRLPPFIKDSLPAIISGKLTADTEVKLRKSHLSSKNFHHARLSGSATLNDFRLDIPDSATSFYTRETTLRFGTNSSFVTDSSRVDSLLTASVRIDTALVLYDGMRLMIKNAKAGVGCKNIASSTDSTQINPIGATISAERVNFRSTDSSRIRLRNILCKASLKRFNQKAKVPELNLLIDARRISYGDKLNRLSLREGNLNITAHLKERQKMGKKMQARYDSISRLYPGLAPDSIYRLALVARKRSNNNRSSVNTESEMLDFDLDNSMKQLLRRWNIHGTITAKRGRLFTPYFPLRNTLTNINFDFTTDSVLLHDIKYTVGQSDFLINGSIRNIRRALTSRRGTPLDIDFRISSDTININEIAQTAFSGAAFSEKSASSVSISHIEDEDSIQMAIEQQTDTSKSAALLIPMNIDATVSLQARNVYYADLLMHRFRGNLYILNGALNLHNLSAKTDMGDIRMSALYTAPTKKDLKFGFGLQIKDLQVNKVLNMIPAVDSLMPLLKDIEGVIDADIAATTDVDTAMNLVIPSLNAAIKIHGDSLVLLDAETFKTLSKWLMFKNKKRNMIDQMTVEMLVENSTLELFPFMFDIDRYRLGIMGHNDLALNLNYHISVLKSPLPFKFGINITGNADDMKIRVGKAKYNEKASGQKIAIVDTTRINLMNQIENVFRRGVNVARLGKLNVKRNSISNTGTSGDIASDTISHADSLLLIKEGILPPPPEPADSTGTSTNDKASRKKRRDR
ncbi:MAG: hypothetical protein IJY31_04060 [Muribaculaceae bacterium]|nr:hypothetical protein [Muribaculaceae bacterium]